VNGGSKEVGGLELSKDVQENPKSAFAAKGGVELFLSGGARGRKEDGFQ